MGYETDKRFSGARFKGAPAARKLGPAGTGTAKSGEAARRAQFAASEKKMDYRHKVVVGTEPTARE